MQLGFTKFTAKCPLQAINDMIVRMVFIIEKDTVVAVYLLSAGKKVTYHTNKSKIVNSVLSNTSNSLFDSLRRMSNKKKKSYSSKSSMFFMLMTSPTTTYARKSHRNYVSSTKEKFLSYLIVLLFPFSAVL